MATITLADERALKTVAIAISAISFIGSCLVVVSYLVLPKLWRFAFKLIVMLAISDIGSSVAYFIGSPADGPVCTLQGCMLQFFHLASLTWTTVIAYMLDRTMKQKGLWVQQHENFCHVYAWGLPLLFTVLPFSTGHLMPGGYAYGHNFDESNGTNKGGWCWINAAAGSSGLRIGNVWRFTTFYMPLWCCMLYNALIYRGVSKLLRNTMKSQIDNTATLQKLKLLRRLQWFPALLLICWFWASINRIQNAISPSKPIFWLYMLHIVFSSSMGFWNSVVYGLNKGVRAVWAESFPRTCAICLDAWDCFGSTVGRVCCCRSTRRNMHPLQQSFLRQQEFQLADEDFRYTPPSQ